MFWGAVFWRNALGAASGAPTLGEALFEISVAEFTDKV
jgi:hypothetical protein